MTQATHLVRLDRIGAQLVRIVCGCTEVSAMGEKFGLLAIATPFATVTLPKRYESVEEAKRDCDLLNCPEHPCSLPALELEAFLTSSSSIGA